MGKTHYTYRITNVEENKFYYGCRSSAIEPQNDLGFKYFSSSTDKNFIKDQKENPHYYKYKIIRSFATRKSAELFETKLHEKFQVQIHDSFYNKAINTKMGFSVVGRKQTPEHIEKRFKNLRGITLEERCGKKRANEIKQKMKGRIVSQETRDKLSKSRQGVKLSQEHKKSISKGLVKRYKDEEFYEKFCNVMSTVNKDEKKRKSAGEKIKAKWQDPDYKEKMRLRKTGSNSNTLKEKWQDPEWREYMLNSRKEKRKKREDTKNTKKK
jgi:hypothetical protein